MKFKVAELLNTKYLYLSITRDFTYMLDTCLRLYADPAAPYNVGSDKLSQLYACFKNKTPVEFDLAEMRITTDATTLINMYAAKGIVFVDSVFEWRDAILEENRRRLAIQYTTEALPPYQIETFAQDWVKSLREDVVYKVPAGIDRTIMLPLIIITQIVRPEVQFDINDVAFDLFEVIADNMVVTDLEDYDEFYVVTPEGISTWKRGAPLHIQRLGYVNMAEATTVATFVPAVFGKKKLIDNELFIGILRKCLTNINKVRANQPKKLSEVI